MARATSCTTFRSKCIPGEIVGILGRNGVGKTTTLQTILGVPMPRNGEIRLRGELLSGKSDVRNRTARHRLGTAGPPHFSDTELSSKILISRRRVHVPGRGR